LCRWVECNRQRQNKYAPLLAIFVHSISCPYRCASASQVDRAIRVLVMQFRSGR
jgi:hypothetical protein